MRVNTIALRKATTLPANRLLSAYLVLSVGIIGFGLSGIFARAANAPGLVIATWRVTIATLLLAVPFLQQEPALRHIDRPARRKLIAAGTIFAANLTIYHIALDYTTAANATFLGNVAPLWVGLVTLFVLKEKLPRLFWPGVALALTGAALILFAHGGGFKGLESGDVIAVTASFFWATYQIITNRARATVSTLTWAWAVMAISALWLIPISLLSGYALTGYSNATMLTILAAGIVSQTLGFTSFNYALGQLSASRVSVANMLAPVITALAAYLLLGESFGGTRLIGGGLVLLGVYLVTLADLIRREGATP